MMLRLPLPLLLLSLVFCVTPLLGASEIDEGIDYRLVEPPQRAQTDEGSIEVLEFFWYGCPHCYHLEPDLKRWLARQPPQVRLRQMPAANSSNWVNHAKAFFAAEQMGVLEQLHEPLFKALQEERRALFDDEQLIAFAAEQGIDEAAFRAAYASFPVDMQVRKSADLATRFGITGVPALVVNGAYVTSPTQTGSRARTFEVVDYLIARELGTDQPAESERQTAEDEAGDEAGSTPMANGL
jgi:thiol:disulfide interchange protein DsbA